jgi:hypothetical protein
MDQEIKAAAMNLAKNKAFEPDGLPNEFLHAFLPAIKHQFYHLFLEFYHHRLNLTELNRANIVMI